MTNVCKNCLFSPLYSNLNRVGLLILLFILSFQIVDAKGSGKSGMNFSLKMENKTVKEVLSKIESSSDYSFFYESGSIDLNRKVNINVENQSIDVVLDQVFKGTGNKFHIDDKQVYISSPSSKTTKDTQQEIKISGVVKDEAGEVLPGVSIRLKNSTKGTLSNVDGHYTLAVPSTNAILIFSYVGFEEKEIKVGTQTSIDVRLKESPTGLDEVVVVGYGTQKKINLTGAIGTVSAEQIANKPVTSLGASLAGVAPGLTVIQNSGAPGPGGATINIRGIGTWENSSPLVLLDGVEVSMDNIIPSQVESISVLKDAASAAIYGSRAANGVILVTSKKGHKGKMRISYDGNVGFETATRRPKMANSYEYAILSNRYGGKYFSDEAIERLKNGTGDPDNNEADTDWYKELLKTGILHMHQISLSGGSDEIVYFGTMGYTNQEGIIDNQTYQRYNLRLNTTATITNWMKLGMNLSFQTGVERFPGTGGAGNAYDNIGRSRPYQPVKYSDGTWSYDTHAGNPVRNVTKDFGSMKDRADITTVQLNPEIKIIEGLMFRGLLGYESSFQNNNSYRKVVKYNEFKNSKGEKMQDASVAQTNSKVTEEWNYWRNLISNATVTYDKAFGVHSFTLLGGGSLETNKFKTSKSGRENLLGDLTDVNGGEAKTAFAEGKSNSHSLASLFARLNYSYAGRYLFEANMRYDGSSKFAKGHQWGTFPSFSAAWRVSEESFFAPVKTYVDNLKFRGSWGKLGNQKSIGNYRFLSTVSAKGKYVFDGKILDGYGENRMGYDAITWESSDNLNIGVDISTLGQRLNVEFDWFNRKTKDLLLPLEAPGLLGIGAPVTNAGEMRNRGWEISVGWRDHIGKDFSYYVNVNLSDVKNEVTDLKGYKSSSTDLQVRMEGLPYKAIYGYKTLGIAYNQELYDKHKDLMLEYFPGWGIGDLIIEDTDGNGVIDGDDKQMIGNPHPRYTYGIAMGADYKGFDLSIFLQGVGKVDGYMKGSAVQALGVNSARKEHFTDTFDPKNPRSDAYYPRLNKNSSDFNYSNLSHWVQDASYLRMKNVQLGYTFNLKQLQKLRVYFSGENLFTITKFRTFDPESEIGGLGGYPNLATYSFGVNVVF